MENKPEYIDDAISNGYDVEIDIRYIDGELYLGHDYPCTKISEMFIRDRAKNLWIHCKNIESLRLLCKDYQVFSHDVDEAVLTSNGFLWTYPGKKLTDMSICVLPEKATTSYNNDQLRSCYGICSDIIEYYKNLVQNL